MGLTKNRAIAVAVAVLALIAGALLAAANRVPLWNESSKSSGTPSSLKDSHGLTKSKEGWGLYNKCEFGYGDDLDDGSISICASLNLVNTTLEKSRKDMLKATRWLMALCNAVVFIIFILAVVAVSDPTSHHLHLFILILSVLALLHVVAALGTYAGYASKAVPSKAFNGQKLKLGGSFAMTLLGLIILLPIVGLSAYTVHSFSSQHKRTPDLHATHEVSGYDLGNEDSGYDLGNDDEARGGIEGLSS